jgi:hypothetical protein
MELSNLPGAFHTPEAQPFWMVYQHIAAPLMAQRVIRKDNPLVGITEHPLDENRRVIIAINYSPQSLAVMLSPAEGWMVDQVWYGQPPHQELNWWACRIVANNAVVFTVCKK